MGSHKIFKQKLEWRNFAELNVGESQGGISRAPSPVSICPCVRPCVRRQDQGWIPGRAGRGAAAHGHPHRALFVPKIAALSHKEERRLQGQIPSPFPAGSRASQGYLWAIEGKDNPCSLSIPRKRFQWPWDEMQEFNPPLVPQFGLPFFFSQPTTCSPELGIQSRHIPSTQNKS